MRVLAVTHSLGSNGAALCLARLLIAVKAAGGTADVVSDDRDGFWVPWLRDHGVGVIPQAQTENYDVAIVNTVTDHRWVARLAPALPVVFWVHEGQSVLDHDAVAAADLVQAFLCSSRLVFSSAWQAESVFSPFLGHVAPHRIALVAPGICLPQANTPRVAATLGAKRVLAIGSVYPRKRPADLVAAMVRLADAQAHCTFAGDLEHLSLNGQDMLDALGAPHAPFTLAGQQGQEQLGRFLADAAVYCNPSGDETFGMGAVEAASWSLPLALSDLPCYRGLWVHGVNALLSPVGAVDCLSWNLKALLQDTALAARLGEAARQTALQFTQERFLRGMSDVLVRAIEDRLLVAG